MNELALIKDLLLAFMLSIPRITAMFITLPMLGKKILGGRLIRNSVVFSMCFVIAPVINNQIETIDINVNILVIIIIKEAFLGVILGFCASIPFWITESAGFFIDNQRGSTMASSLNPALETQTSPMGIHFTHTLLTIFYTSHAYIFLIAGIYKSFIAWPPAFFFPNLNYDSVSFLVGQLVYLMQGFILYSSPVIVAMFMSEFGLALVSRFAPQLNVFFLAMPIKSAVAGFILIIYFKYLVENISIPMYDVVNIFNYSFGLFK